VNKGDYSSDDSDKMDSLIDYEREGIIGFDETWSKKP
jgi:hypothetical protein